MVTEEFHAMGAYEEWSHESVGSQCGDCPIDVCEKCVECGVVITHFYTILVELMTSSRHR